MVVRRRELSWIVNLGGVLSSFLFNSFSERFHWGKEGEKGVR